MREELIGKLENIYFNEVSKRNNIHILDTKKTYDILNKIHDVFIYKSRLVELTKETFVATGYSFNSNVYDDGLLIVSNPIISFLGNEHILTENGIFRLDMSIDVL